LSPDIGRVDDEPRARVSQLVERLPESGLVGHVLDHIEGQYHIESAVVPIAKRVHRTGEYLEAELPTAVVGGGIGQLDTGCVPPEGLQQGQKVTFSATYLEHTPPA
jgi:hypothetical protein